MERETSAVAPPIGAALPRRLAGAGRRLVGERAPRGMGWAIALSLLPGTVLFVTFFLIPLGVLVVTSFARWSVLGFEFIGIENYSRLIHDDVFWKALRNTTLYAAASVLIQVPLGVIVGMILAERIRGWRVLRAILFTPIVISGAAFALTFAAVYNARYGLLNQALDLIGVEGRDWLFDTRTALPAVMGTFVFIIGFFMVLVMTEITAIPVEVIEAAQIDGASRLQRQLYITLPLLRHVVGTCILLALLTSLASFDVVYILTAGGPADATVTLTVYAFRAYTNDEWGYANALGVFVVVAGFLLIVAVRRLFRLGEREL